ncbi:MAG: tRNA (guanosine(46)-N7)-methyltransferase TrmB [Bacteroidetes bacterium]|nr:tRNA (guanosine(46)-N7)-methyltransferase TrmB [Bacteroidota bacterium]
MSQRNKLRKFAEVLAFPNVYENFDSSNPALTGENGQTIELKGKWNELHFKNANPITLELACGKGDYAVGLAQRFPDRNFIGVDIKGARIWRGAKTALELGLQNVAFLRTRIEQIALFFEENEVDEIWITFPDPFLRNSKSNRRLTSPMFLEQYRKFLKKGGLVHLKTDERLLHEFTLGVLAQQDNYEIRYHDDDIYANPLPLPELEIKTFYEKQHLAAGKTIKYIRFQRKS